MRLILAVIILSLCGCAMPTKDSVCLGKPITGEKTTPSLLVPVADSDPFTIAFDCGTAMCVIVKVDLIKLMRQNTEWHERMTAAEKQIEDAKPKCAELTVTEPSKSFKKPPPIKVERDS